MYDSRTHKPRRPGTNRYASRAWREQEDWEGEFSKPTVSADLALAEGLDDREDVEFAYGPDCEWEDPMAPVAIIGVEVEPEAPAWSSDWDFEDEDDYEHYGDPAERVDVYVDDDGEEYHAGPIEDLDADTEWTWWLPLMSYEEACEELAYGFTIEGPSPQPEPLREGHYVRVYQLARDLGVDSKPLVAHLREIGEYVATHQSWVANPVADRLRADNSLAPLAWALGGRTTATTGTQSLDALIREEGRRYAARPVPPRPGNNPFAGLYR